MSKHAGNLDNGKLALHQKQAEIEGDIHIAAPTDTLMLIAKWISVSLKIIHP